MTFWTDACLLLLVLTGLVLLGTGRLSFGIRVVAVQGWVLGLLPLLHEGGTPGTPAFLLAALALTVKGVIFPWLLTRALRDANVRHEVDPVVGLSASLIIGIAVLVPLLAFGPHLLPPFPLPSRFWVPAAFFLVFTGLFLISARRQALTQVLGYLVLENGVYTFGALLMSQQPWLVELGILLDVLVAVLIMGVIIFHISREFDHIDTEHLTHLRDWRRAGQDDLPSSEGKGR